MAKIPATEKQAADQAAYTGNVAGLAGFLQIYGDDPQVAEWYRNAGHKASNSPEDDARQIIYHLNHFNSWTDYQKFQTDLQTDLQLQQFEQAADAIAAGDTVTLKQLLAQNPGLVRMRSRRHHHSTLLNYVGANGVEGYRQKTPGNAVDIAQLLLDAGAGVDDRGDMYRGTSTLGLVATSVHPVTAGVQQELMELLINRGADPNHAVAPDYTGGLLILACIHNGRYEPIHYLAARGATVDLEGAGALGDLEKVISYFNANGQLTDPTLTTKRDSCLIWACVYGHKNVVDFLFAHGCSIHTVWDHSTPLHSAAFGGQVELVRWLLDKGAPMEVLNEYGGTVLGTTLWCLYHYRKPGHLQIMEMLIAAGAEIKDNWQIYIDEQRNNS